VCIYIHVVVRTNLCKNVVLRGCGTLRGSISYFLTTRTSQMNVEVASDVDPEYYLSPRSVVNVQVCVGRRCVWACILIFVWLQGKIHVGEWYCEVVKVARFNRLQGTVYYFLAT